MMEFIGIEEYTGATRGNENRMGGDYDSGRKDSGSTCR